MALNKTQLEEIKTQFNTELKSALKTRCTDEEIEKLIKSLESNGFYTAPATTQFFCSFDGGLMLHSLNTYHTLNKLVNEFCPGKYTQDTLAIVGLLHCISKSVFYEKVIGPKKVYNENGSKKDNGGKFDWLQVEKFQVKDVRFRNTFGSESINSFIYVNSYIKLKPVEIEAIINYQLDVGTGNVCKDIFPILGKYELVTLLHSASLIASYILEKAPTNE